MILSPSRKGYYSILTTFFFVVVALAVVMSIFYFQSQILGLNEANTAKTTRYITVQAAKDTIIGCNDGVTFLAEDLNSDLLNRCLPNSINGVALDASPCQGAWKAGNLTGASYEYKVLVAANETCLSDLQIYHGEANP